MTHARILLLGTTISTVILYFLRPIFGNDYWWHSKAGQYMLTHQEIPFIDVFSWFGVENGLHWYSHEWLSEVVFAWTEMNFGLIGVWLFTFMSAVLIIGFVLFLNRRELSRNALVLAPFIGALGASLSLVYLPRPHMISLLFFVWVMGILIRFIRNQGSRSIYLIPVITLLWANFHGGSSNLPYTLTFILFVVGCFNFKFGIIEFTPMTRKQLQTLAIVTFTSILAIVINPHGIEMIAYPYVNMSDSLMLSFIQEWQSPNFNAHSGKIAYTLFLAIAVLFTCQSKRLDGTDLALIGAFTLLTAKSIRFAPFLAIAMFFILPRYIPTFKPTSKYAMPAISGTLICAILMIVIPSLEFVELVKDTPIVATVSEELATTIREYVENTENVNLYNDYDIGGDLIYYDIPVFFDARADLYSSTILNDAVSLSLLSRIHGEEKGQLFNPETIIEKYELNAFAIQKGRALAGYLTASDNYELVASDGVVDFFVSRK